MKEEGLSSYNAFKRVMETTNLYNENVIGTGKATGPVPLLNEYSEREEVEEANNNVYNGGSNAAKPVNARLKKASAAPPPVPTQEAKPAAIPAPWHVETNAQKRKRLANAANKRKTANNKNKKGGKRRTRSRRSL